MHGARKLNVVAGVVLVFSRITSAVVTQTPLPSFRDLGNIPGVTSLAYHVSAISADGSVVAGNVGTVAFAWTAATGMQAITAYNSRAKGISADGSTIVGEYYPNPGTTEIEPFLWTSAGGFVDIGSLPKPSFRPYNQASARAISGDGSVIVGYSNETGAIWTSSGITPLPNVTDGSTANTIGYAISPDGRFISGSSETPSHVVQATLWTDGVPQRLLDPSDGISQGFAYDVTPDGSVVVGQVRYQGTDQAFRWTSATGMQSLGGTTALGVSADGSRVVGYDNGSLGAILWDSQHGTRSLQSVLENDCGLDLSNWTLDEAYGISADGNEIAGRALNLQTGREAAYLATLPEPQCMLVMCAGATIVLNSRRRRAH